MPDITIIEGAEQEAEPAHRASAQAGEFVSEDVERAHAGKEQASSTTFGRQPAKAVSARRSRPVKIDLRRLPRAAASKIALFRQAHAAARKSAAARLAAGRHAGARKLVRARLVHGG